MLNFDYQNCTRTIFGRDAHKNVGEFIRPLANKVLLHYGGGSIKKSGLYDDVVKSLRENNVSFVELGGVKPNPRLSLVYEGIELCRKESIDFILAVGGGSVIDSAKAIAMGVCTDKDVWENFYVNGNPVEKALPVATILTITAAGSESSPDTVITNESTLQKFGYGDNHIRPVFSIINPELFYTVPENQVANGVCDMMSHIFERYFTNTKQTDLMDGLCESTLKTIMRNALILRYDNKSYDAWSNVSLGGMFAHNGFIGQGREQDWASHAMEHELSAIYDIPHGAGLAVVTPAWMKYVYKENPDMFVQFAVNVMGTEGSFRDSEAIILEGISRIEKFFVSMGLETKLSGLGIDNKNFELMAKKATGFKDGKENPIGGFKKLGWKDIVEIYKLAE